MVFVVVILLILILLTLASISSKLEEALSRVRNKGTLLGNEDIGGKWLDDALDEQNPLPPKPRKKQAVKKTTTLRKAQVRGANGRFAAKAK
jgi:hypothetical protein